LEGSDFNDIKVTKKPKERKPVIEYLKVQGRFKHLMDKPDELQKIQDEVDEKCQKYGF
jgi:pyruvate/2-oxoacid:ferredoxin oxidoreductase beta subunit